MLRISIYLLIASMGWSCNKVFDVACPMTDENEGLIIQAFTTADADCFANTFSLEGLKDGFVIQDEQQYGAIIPALDPLDSPCQVIGIDFTDYTLLGILTEGTGCSISYRRTVEKDGITVYF